MRNGLLGSIAALAASAGLAFAQAPARTGGIEALPGRALAQPMPGSVEPVPMGPSTIVNTPAAGSFYAAMQPQVPLGDQDQQQGGARITGQLDYLLWFLKPWTPVVPLVTTSTTGPRGAVGPTTSVAYGIDDLTFNPYSGGRFTVDLWLPKHPRIGWEFVGMVLENRTSGFTAGYGTQMVARPVIDASTGQATSLTIAAPGYASGGVTVGAQSQMWGFESNSLFRLWSEGNKEIDLLYGFRYLDLKERLDISQRSIFVPGVLSTFYGIPFFSPAEIDVADTFQTRNQIYMSQVGISAKCRFNRWSFQWVQKIGVGPVYETLVVNGNSTLFQTASGPANTVPGGLLALSSNIGRWHSQGVWAVVPDGAIQVGYRFFQATDLVVGYQFMYVSRAIRPTSTMDQQVSPNLVPTSAAFGAAGPMSNPAVTLHQTDLWAQGLNVGLYIHY